MITRTVLLSFRKVTQLKYYHWGGKKNEGKKWNERGKSGICRDYSIGAGSLTVMYDTK